MRLARDSVDRGSWYCLEDGGALNVDMGDAAMQRLRLRRSLLLVADDMCAPRHYHLKQLVRRTNVERGAVPGLLVELNNLARINRREPGADRPERLFELQDVAIFDRVLNETHAQGLRKKYEELERDPVALEEARLRVAIRES